ncbi:hypothetical protein H5410_045582 [Solanum commersonii]|uniref:Non-haem dioxygenase N-terminal domain-containing protein n=1 Tax=Solanum commersonii TaxID=4109 RepID=A0A9J5XD60_SOLCO|nr:hypothetical protein H5410_045582 [Solanum commersonii]
MKNESNIPTQYIWPDDEKPCVVAQELHIPLIDLRGFFSTDPAATQQASRLVGEACRSHDFFLVVNHGVDSNLISKAHHYMDTFFDMPLSENQKAQREIGDIVAMPTALLEGFLQSYLGKRHSLYDTLLNKTHLT